MNIHQTSLWNENGAVREMEKSSGNYTSVLQNKILAIL